MQYLDIALIVMFAIASVWLLSILIKQNKILLVSGKLLTMNRMLMLGIMVICMLPIFLVKNDILVVIRSVVVVITVILLFLLKDGLTKEGILFSGVTVPWTTIMEAHIVRKKNKVCLLFTARGTKRPKQRMIEFEMKAEEELVRVAKKRLQKKLKTIPAAMK